MKLTLKTNVLKEMVGKAVRGAGNDESITRTQLMSIAYEKGTLTLTTTDATNYLFVKEKVDLGKKKFEVVVWADKFARLISKLTCEMVSMEIKDNSLEVNGNGKYNLELPIDSEGELATFSTPDLDIEGDETEIDITTIKTILNVVKPSLAADVEIPCYTGYYVGDKVIATDTFKISALNQKLLDNPRLISAELMNLCDTISDDKINVKISENKILLSTPHCIIYGICKEGLDDFAIEPISNLLDTEFESDCKLSKVELLSALGRLSLFVGAYDKNGVYLTFNEDGVMISSLSSSGVESIPYIESNNYKEFTCCIDILTLSEQVKAQPEDAIHIYYGKDNSIKMVSDGITQVIALIQK